MQIEAKLIQNNNNQFFQICFYNDKKKTTRYLLRHLPGHHGTRRHLTRRHPRRWHHTRRGHIRWLTWHVHHTRGLAHRGHSLRGERQKCLASSLMPTMRPLYSCQRHFKWPISNTTSPAQLTAIAPGTPATMDAAPAFFLLPEESGALTFFFSFLRSRST